MEFILNQQSDLLFYLELGRYHKRQQFPYEYDNIYIPILPKPLSSVLMTVCQSMSQSVESSPASQLSGQWQCMSVCGPTCQTDLTVPISMQDSKDWLDRSLNC